MPVVAEKGIGIVILVILSKEAALGVVLAILSKKAALGVVLVILAKEAAFGVVLPVATEERVGRVLLAAHRFCGGRRRKAGQASGQHDGRDAQQGVLIRHRRGHGRYS